MGVMKADLQAARAVEAAAERQAAQLQEALGCAQQAERDARGLGAAAWAGLRQLAAAQGDVAAKVDGAAARLGPLTERLHFAMQRC
eukprot:7206697-Prymnesium_polylepis.1